MTTQFDIAIVGGGMAGASLAVALEGLGVRTALIEAVPYVIGDIAPSSALKKRGMLG